MNKINNIDMKKWKDYDDIYSDSLWIIDKREKSSTHKGDYHGNFVPQIPYQLLQRYTKEGDWVLDPFLGSGTTLIECRLLNRNGIGIDIDENILQVAKERAESEIKTNTTLEFLVGDSKNIDIKNILKKNNINSIDFVIMHPPYWDIIKFNDNKENLSNTKTIEEFIKAFGKVVNNTTKYLKKNRYVAIVIGDIYKKGEWIPLNTYIINLMQKKKFLLKSIIVKNIDETKGKRNQRNIWRYRSLLGGFYIFKHEYILIFKKTS